MTKNYNVIGQTLEIKDDLKTHFLTMKLLMIIWIIIGISSLIGIFKEQTNLWSYIQIFLGFLAMIGLYDYQFKKTSENKILISEIESITERKILGTNRYYILLKNGKRRSLPDVNSSLELEGIKKLINQ
jgi:hypothetical protein